MAERTAVVVVVFCKGGKIFGSVDLLPHTLDLEMMLTAIGDVLVFPLKVVLGLVALVDVEILCILGAILNGFLEARFHQI